MKIRQYHFLIILAFIFATISQSFAQTINNTVSDKIFSKGELNNIFYNLEVIKEKPNMKVDNELLTRLKEKIASELAYAGAIICSPDKNEAPALNISLVCSKFCTINDKWAYLTYSDCRYFLSTADIEKANYLSLAEQNKDPEESKTQAIQRFSAKLLDSREFQQMIKIIKGSLSKTNLKSNKPKEIVADQGEYLKEVSLSDIDINIPVTRNKNRDAIAVVIGNSNYQKTKKVDFAINDANSVKKYLVDVFGFKEENIFYIRDASKSDFEIHFGNEKSHKGKLFNAVKEGKSDIFVYYSGHGAPGLKDRKAYFVPVEADPQYLDLSGYPADIFYQNLSRIPSRSTTVIIDACFSGTTIFENISPMVLTINNPVLDMKNCVVLSSSTGKQVSTWYNDKKHGMFTYFFLKAIKDKLADKNKDNSLSFEEIYQYISDKTEGVPFYARRLHGIEQDPTIEGNYRGKVLVNY